MTEAARKRRNWPEYRRAPAPSAKLKTAQRICLSCLTKFKSSWSGERICYSCKVRGAPPDVIYWGIKRHDR